MISRKRYLSLPQLSLCSLLLAQAAIAQTGAPTDMPQYGQWYSSRIGGGGYVQNVVTCPDNPNRLYTYIDVGGLYISEDHGQHWRMLHGGLPPMRGNYAVRGLLVDPRNSDKLIIATGSRYEESYGIFTSDDAGKTWWPSTQMFFDGNSVARDAGQILARHPQNPDIILAASVDTGLWKSVDNGKNWSQHGMTGLFPCDLRFDRNNPDRLWLSAWSTRFWMKGKEYKFTSGFYRSLDGGTSWTKLSDESPYEIVQDPIDANIIYGIFDRKLIRRSQDAGTTWHDFSDGLLINTNPIPGDSISSYRYRAMGSGPDFIIVASSNGDVYTLKHGETRWQKAPRESIEDHNLPRGKNAWGWATSSIVVDPRDPKHWFITDYFGLSQTYDAGKTWDITINGIENTVIFAVAQDPSDPGIVHLGMADNAYFLSKDGGASFRNHSLPRSANSCKSFDVSPNLPSRIYAVGSIKHDQQIGHIYISVDRGETWDKAAMIGLPDLTKEMCISIAADYNDPYTAYVTISGEIKPNAGGVYKTTDGGKNWTWISQGLPVQPKFFHSSPWSQGRELAAGPDGTIVAIRGTSSDSVYYFDSRAQSWQPAKIDLENGSPRSVVPDLTTPGRFYIGVRGSGVYRSTDSGRTWTKVFSGSATHVAADKVVANRVAASTNDGVIFSDDGGNNWRVLDRSLPDRVTGNMPAFAGDRLVVGSDGSGAFWIPLNSSGLKPVAAQPLPNTAGTATAKQFLVNGYMEDGASSPTGWNIWNNKGKLRTTRYTEDPAEGKGTLIIESVGGEAKGAIHQEFSATPGMIEVTGWGKVINSPKVSADVAIQVFNEEGKQIEWIGIAHITTQPEHFKKFVSIPEGAAKCKIVLLFDGQGQAWFDEMSVMDKSRNIYKP